MGSNYGIKATVNNTTTETQPERFGQRVFVERKNTYIACVPLDRQATVDDMLEKTGSILSAVMYAALGDDIGEHAPSVTIVLKPYSR